MLFGRRRFDPQPTAPAAVLLATAGEPFSKEAIRRARELAAGEPIAVLAILKVYGSALGLPNPGLLPTRKEREQQFAVVQRAIADLERRGGSADGQIAATRSAGRTIVKVARARKVRYVVMDEHDKGGLGRMVQGGVAGTVRRGLRDGTELDLVPARAASQRPARPSGQRPARP
jgi:nucleotide-binding universal stress UspA family protein